MGHVKYTGTSDLYVLSADDLKKADVEGFKKTEFPQGQPVEVADGVAEALTSNDFHYLFGGEFEQMSDEEVADLELTPAQRAKKAAEDKPTSSKASTRSGSAQTGGGTAGGTTGGTAGNGSSTATA